MWRLKRDIELVGQVLCAHRWMGGDLGSPRFCRECGLRAGSRRCERVDILRRLIHDGGAA